MHRLPDKIPTRTLFHYTSQQGLMGIARNQVLWASKAHYLSDESEIRYGLDLLEGEIRQLKNLKQKDKNVITSLQALLQHERDMNIFVASFSEDGDLLSQWRAYCPDMGGYSIGFTYDHLKPHLQRQNLHLKQCIYDEDDQKQKVKKFLELCTNHARLEELKWNTGDLAREFLYIVMRLKDPSFKEEREWRIFTDTRIEYTHTQVDFREGKSTITPFFKIELASPAKPFAFETIYVGPTPHPDLAVNAVRGLILKYVPCEDVELLLKYVKNVQKSTIPYRAW